jgi:hypothetical protein
VGKGTGVTGETNARMAAEGTPLIAKRAKYLVTLHADTLTIRMPDRDKTTVQSTRLYDGETPEEALLRLGYTRATLGDHTQSMPWSARSDGSLWTSAERAERQP